MKSPALAVTIAGSPSASSVSTRILDHAAAKLVAAGFRTKAIRVRELPASAVISADRKVPAIAAALECVRGADVVLVSTPIYKAAYSGILKSFLDLLPQDAFRDKVVVPIASGGSAANALAIDYMLRPVLCSLAPREVVSGIYSVDGQATWSADFGLRLDAQLTGQLQRALDHIANVVPAWKPSVPPVPRTERSPDFLGGEAFWEAAWLA